MAKERAQGVDLAAQLGYLGRAFAPFALELVLQLLYLQARCFIFLGERTLHGVVLYQLAGVLELGEFAVEVLEVLLELHLFHVELLLLYHGLRFLKGFVARRGIVGHPASHT